MPSIRTQLPADTESILRHPAHENGAVPQGMAPTTYDPLLAPPRRTEPIRRISYHEKPRALGCPRR